MSIADLKVRISANAEKFDSTMKKMGKSFDKTVRKMERTGKQLTQKLTVPIGIMALAAGKAAIDFESAFAGVRKTVDATEAEFAGLRKGIIEMSKVMPTSAGEIAGVAEAAGQLGIQTDAILGFTETMVKLGDTTNLSAQEAATALARFANILQLPQDQFDEMGSTIVDLGNNFATTEAEITEFATRMAGAGSIAGLAASDIFGIAAAMSSVGVQAEAGGTAVQKVLININTAVAESNDMLVKFADVAGMSAQEFQTAWKQDAGQTFAAFVNGLGRQGDQAAGVLDDLGLADQRLIRAFLSLANAGDLVNKSLDTASEAWKENTALTEEAEKRYRTVWSRLLKLKNRIVALGISIGDALMPMIEGSIKFVERLTKAFDNLSAEAKVRVLAIAGLFAASGPLMFALAKFARVIKGLFVFVKSKFAIMAAGVLLVVVAGQNMIDNWRLIRENFKKLLISIELSVKEMAKSVLQSIQDMINAIDFKTLDELFGTQFDLPDPTSVSNLQKAIDGLDASIIKVNEDLGFQDRLIKNMDPTGFAESAKNAWEKFKNTIENLLGMSIEGTAFEDLLNTMKESFEKIDEKVIKLIDNTVQLQVISIPSIGVSGFSLPDIDLSSMKANIQKQGKELSDIVKIALSGSVEEFDDAQKQIEQRAENFARVIEQTMANAIISFATSIGELAAGATSLKDLASGLINVLADMAIQIGSLFVALGTAAALSLNPATLIASLGTSAIVAGAALIAAGAALKAIFSRDIGGPVFADQPVFVGKGPHQELFIPDRSGSIMPNSKLRGMGGDGLSEAAMARAFSSALAGAKLRVSGTDLVLVTTRGQNKLSR